MAEPWRVDGDDLILAVRLTPRSAKDAMGGIWIDEKGAGWLQVQVRAVPEKGLANAALIRVMAKMLDLAARHITLEAGDTSRLKRLRIRHMGHTIARVEARLKTS